MSTPRPVMFVDRDGTLIEEPDDRQVDDYAKVRLVPGVISALLRLREAGWDFIMVTNQDGLGTEGFPIASFQGPHDLLLQILASQGITFREVFIDPHPAGPGQPWTRKPGIGMVAHLLKDRSIDWDRSVMVGDRHTDREFADALGIPAYLLPSRVDDVGDVALDWSRIAHVLVTRPRTAHVERVTAETRITVDVDLDREDDRGAGTETVIDTGINFLDHMLDQLARHGGFTLRVACQGDLHIDDHHTAEDVALAVGEAIATALGDKRGIGRYGFTLPMDEAQATAALDLSGRPYFAYQGSFQRERVGDLSTEMVEHFWRSFADALRCTLHLSVTGTNTHHQVEVGFKAVARALRQAIQREGTALPSTKGVL